MVDCLPLLTTSSHISQCGLPVTHKRITCPYFLNIIGATCPKINKSSQRTTCPHYINYYDGLLVHSYTNDLSGPLVHTILIIKMEYLSILINYQGGPLVCTILIIMMTAGPHSYKLSWQTACLHYMSYYDIPLVHTYINYHSGPFVRNRSVIMVDCLSTLT